MNARALSMLKPHELRRLPAGEWIAAVESDRLACAGIVRACTSLTGWFAVSASDTPETVSTPSFTAALFRAAAHAAEPDRVRDGKPGEVFVLADAVNGERLCTLPGALPHALALYARAAVARDLDAMHHAEAIVSELCSTYRVPDAR